ncbi:MAG: glycosyltransferase family 2 protein [Desulfovibrionaceae bacterium]|nr:glycosyltransferase family 2 protein [Desulfovibrionaceae bacterium]
MQTSKKCISLIISVLNEEETIPLFLKAIEPVITAEPNYDFEIIFVNDGSTDGTVPAVLRAREQDARIKLIDFTRNFGKENGMAAGFHAATGDAAIPLDVDLQDPPELIHQFLRKWEEGYEVVVGVRRQRTSDTPFKRLTAGMFYKIFNIVAKASRTRLIPNAGDYRLLDRSVLDALNQLPERVRFTKGLYAWVGFKQAVVEYERPQRVAGSTKWNAFALWNFALDGITSFSTLPLRVWSYMGMGFSCMGFLYAVWLVLKTLIWGVDVPGYASLMVVVLVLGGLILMSLGIHGEYMGRIYEEVKNRPLYIVRKRVGFDEKEGKKNVL